jgi:putative transcriptional regulator
LSRFEERAFEDELAHAADTTRLEVAAFDAVVSQLGFSVEEAMPSADLRPQLLARIANEPKPVAQPAPSPRSTHLDVFAEEGQWMPLFAGGACKILFTEPTNGYVTSLLKLEPGTRIPDHHHRGNEQCLVVAGEFRMNGRQYKPGDFTVALGGSDHLDVFTATGGVLLLVSPPNYEVIAH